MTSRARVWAFLGVAAFAVLVAGVAVVHSALGAAVIKCQVGGWCPFDGRCTLGLVEEEGEGRCYPVGPAPVETFQLPLDAPDGISCVHGPADGVGTHAFLNSLFAVDLASRADVMPAVVRAARDGTVEGVHTSCKDPGGSSYGHSDLCGRGFGNWVRLEHDSGYASFYAHLARVDVHRGDKIKAGEVLGVEGTTGITGHRHLHFAVQQRAVHPLDGKPCWQSVPFDLSFRRGSHGQPSVHSVEDLACHLNDESSQGWFAP